MYRTIGILVIVLLSSVVAGCALPVRQAGEPAPFVTTGKQAYWWFARYQMVWPEEKDPDWRVDLLLADMVIKPVLNANRQQIRYWRFHRRANRDGAGHQFSFIFYSDKETAAKVYAALASVKLTGRLMKNHILQRVGTDKLENNHQSGVQDTSDKNWSETLQIAWPAYIMGVSDMWLQLIEQNVDEYPPDADVDELLQRYGTANDKITALWQNEGRHAFLHHLNALFGYVPITISEPVKF